MSLKDFLNELMKQEDEDYKENIQSAAGKNPPYSPPEQAETVLIEPSVEFTDDELFVRSGTIQYGCKPLKTLKQVRNQILWLII